MTKTYAWSDDGCGCCCDPQTGKCSGKTKADCTSPFVWKDGGASECPHPPEEPTEPETPCSELAVYKCEGPEECTCTWLGKSFDEITCDDQTVEQWTGIWLTGSIYGDCSCEGKICSVFYHGNCHLGDAFASHTSTMPIAFSYSRHGDVNDTCYAPGGNQWVLKTPCGEDCIEDGTHPGGNCEEGDTRKVPCKECFKYYCDDGECKEVACTDDSITATKYDTQEECAENCGSDTGSCCTQTWSTEKIWPAYPSWWHCSDNRTSEECEAFKGPGEDGYGSIPLDAPHYKEAIWTRGGKCGPSLVSLRLGELIQQDTPRKAGCPPIIEGKFACIAGDGCLEHDNGEYSSYLECLHGCSWGSCCINGDCDIYSTNGYWTKDSCVDTFYPGAVFHQGRSCKSPTETDSQGNSLYGHMGIPEEPPC